MAVCELRTTFEGLGSFVAGERVSCVVTIKAPDGGKGDKAQNTVLRAVAVQVVGIFNYNHQWCAPPSDPKQQRSKDALFDPVLVDLGLPTAHITPTPPAVKQKQASTVQTSTSASSLPRLSSLWTSTSCLHQAQSIAVSSPTHSNT